MSKLIHKLSTKPGKETVHKRDTNFPFATLPKERKTLQFSNSAIEKYLPTLRNTRSNTLGNNFKHYGGMMTGAELHRASYTASNYGPSKPKKGPYEI